MGAAPGSTLPPRLRAGIEAKSGFDMSDVRVHRNSSRPAALGALAVAQGRDIHLGPGQDRHLPHEAWHVVQQKQGRVAATVRADNGEQINDAPALEAEATRHGDLAARYGAAASAVPRPATAPMPAAPGVAQCMTVNVRRRQKLVQDAAGGSLAGQESEWDSKFDVDIVGQTVVVSLRIKAAISPDLFQQNWAPQIEQQWSNRFALEFDGKVYPIVVKMTQVDAGEHYTVATSDSGSALGSGARGHLAPRTC